MRLACGFLSSSPVLTCLTSSSGTKVGWVVEIFVSWYFWYCSMFPTFPQFRKYLQLAQLILSCWFGKWVRFWFVSFDLSCFLLVIAPAVITSYGWYVPQSSSSLVGWYSWRGDIIRLLLLLSKKLTSGWLSTTGLVGELLINLIHHLTNRWNFSVLVSPSVDCSREWRPLASKKLSS